jgi:hypothetical protein
VRSKEKKDYDNAFHSKVFTLVGTPENVARSICTAEFSSTLENFKRPKKKRIV